MLKGLGDGLLLAAAMLALAAPCHSAPHTPTPTPTASQLGQDPAVKHGVLANGLRYMVMRNRVPAKGTSIRLGFNVGSFEEADDERGAAHFVEHMAFRSSRDFPQGVLDERFALLGVSIGRDQNAFTSMTSTVYTVDLPSSDGVHVRRILEWMRNAADGINFTDAGVAIERGVVLAEMRSQTNATLELAKRIQRFQAPELRSTHRDPIGTEASLRALTARKLKAFHDRWYRPENAVLVVVGDTEPEKMEALAADIFEGWVAKDPAPVRPEPPKLAARALDAFTQSGSDIPSTVGACRLTPPPEKSADPLAAMRAEFLSKLWSAMLTQRLTRTANEPGTVMLGGVATVDDDQPDARLTCLFTMPVEEKWEAALAKSQAELRRFASAGPTDIEFERMIENVRSSLRGAVVQSGTRASPAIANQILEAALKNKPVLSPAQAMRAYDLAVENLTPEDIKAAVARDWSGAGPYLTASAPQAPAPEQLLAAWTANESASPLDAYTDRVAMAWPYTNFGTKGTVVKRESFPDLDFTRFHFANGTVLNFKKTDFEANTTDVRVRFGTGQNDLGSDTLVPAMLAAGLFPAGGLGKMSFEDIQTSLAGTSHSFSLEIQPQAFVFETRPLGEQVPQQMRLLAAFMTDPGFRKAIDEKLPTVIDLVIRMFSTEPNAVAGIAAEKALYPDSPGLESLNSFRTADFERILKPILLQSPVEVTIVGAAEEASAIEAVATTFGALPPRTGHLKKPDPAMFRAYPEQLPAPLTSTHLGLPDRAAAIVTWPLFVANEERRHEEYALTLLARIFDVKLRHKVRGELGKTYSPTVVTEMADLADQGSMAVSIEASPADIQQMVDAITQVAGTLAAGEITAADVDQAREPLVIARSQAQRSNAAWANVLSASYRFPGATTELLDFKRMMEAVSLGDVRRAAAEWLKRRPLISVAVPKSEGQAQ